MAEMVHADRLAEMEEFKVDLQMVAENEWAESLRASKKKWKEWAQASAQKGGKASSRLFEDH